MHILGIETSCDETSAAVVHNGRTVLSNITLSSLKEHSHYGGIIPEIASRRQMECIYAVVEEALNKAQLTQKKIDAIAVTQSPGLIGSLLVGISFSKALSYSMRKPYIPVDHIKAHLYANFLKKPKEKRPKPILPAIGLVVSGGHTQLYLIKDFGSFKCIGQTRDDAAGEAFDKVARILELGYPGGPVIDRLSKTVKNTDIQFTCNPFPGTLDFSFSGIKTAVLYYTQKHQKSCTFSKAEVAFAFQKSVINSLVQKTILACRKYQLKTILIGGGVAANHYLRTSLESQCQQHRLSCHFPEFEYCLDNAAMIGGLAYHQ